MKTKQLIYLACPYSGSCYQEHLRFIESCKAAGMLLQQGYHVISPISQNHPIAQVCGLQGNFDHWRELNEAMIDLCDFVAVLPLHGWENSKGVQGEITYAKKIRRPVYLIDVYNYRPKQETL